MAFPQEFMDELTARSDIVSIISRYVSLNSRGGRHVGLCPFHNEKTPSFSVSSDKQFFHCFGCGVGGDVITFVMRIENLDFPEAVAKLAEWAGLEVPASNFSAEQRNKKKRALDACRDAARFFHESLKGGVGAEARKYFAARMLSPSSITSFGLGFAPDTWSSMLDRLTAQGYTKTELMDAGLLSAGKNGNVFDRFRNRVMFPIIDVRGAVIGFGGRVMGGGEPKYLNSPESSIFNKRKNLYALNIARRSAADYMILAEGYMDVIALHQAGFNSAVASLGTALTEDQARLIMKYKGLVIIAYDSDGAGRAATDRAMSILKNVGLRVKVLNMTGAKDPDEYIKKFGRDRFAKLLENASAATEYSLSVSKTRFDLNDDAQRVEYLKEAISKLAAISSTVEREIYAARVAAEAKVTRDAILEEVERERKRLFQKRRRDEEKRALNPMGSIVPKNKSVRYRNPRSAIAEEGLVSLMATDRKICHDASEALSADMFSSELLGRLFTEIVLRNAQGQDTGMADLAQSFTAEEREHIASVFARHMDERPAAAADYIETVKGEHVRKEAADDDNDFLRAAEFYKKKKGSGNG